MDGRRSETLRRRGNGRDWARMTLWRNPDRPGAEGATPISRSGIPANLSGKRTERASFSDSKGKTLPPRFFPRESCFGRLFFHFYSYCFLPGRYDRAKKGRPEHFSLHKPDAAPVPNARLKRCRRPQTCLRTIPAARTETARGPRDQQSNPADGASCRLMLYGQGGPSGGAPSARDGVPPCCPSA